MRTQLIAFVIGAVISSTVPTMSAAAPIFQTAAAADNHDGLRSNLQRYGVLEGDTVNLTVLAERLYQMQQADGTLATLPEQFRSLDAYRERFLLRNGFSGRATVSFNDLVAQARAGRLLSLEAADFSSASPAAPAASEASTAATPQAAPAEAPRREIVREGMTAQERATMNRLLAERQEAQGQLTALQNRIASMEPNLVTADERAKLAQLQGTLDSINRRIGELRTDVAELQRDVTNQGRTIGSLQETVDRHNLLIFGICFVGLILMSGKALQLALGQFSKRKSLKTRKRQVLAPAAEAPIEAETPEPPPTSFGPRAVKEHEDRPGFRLRADAA